MSDRRQIIIDAGLMTLREHGYTGFTQPRVAAAAGLRQSALTYYFPTRLDLLTAVARAAVDRQLMGVHAMLANVSSVEEAAQTLAAVVSRHENTRVLMALAQAGDEEPKLREIFCDLVDGNSKEAADLLRRIGKQQPNRFHPRLVHSLSVGLAVVTLATGRPGDAAIATELIRDLLRLIVDDDDPEVVPPITPDASLGGE